MKSYKILIAALLVLPVFFSCGGKHNPEKPDNGKETPVTPTPTPTPTPSNPDNPPTPPTPPEPEPEPPIEFRRTVRFGQVILSFNSSNDFVAIYPESIMTKSGDSRKISTGTYTFSQDDKTYTLKDFGTLEVLKDDKVAFTPKGGERKEYKAETTLIVDNEASEASRINRTWTIKETILRMDDRGVNYSDTGLDLNAVEKMARDQGFEFKFHMEDNMVVTKVIITDALLAAEFKNGKAYAAEHTLRSGTDFNLSEFTNGLKGTAKVQFIEDLCTITINTSLDESPAKIILTMVEKK